MSPHFSTHYVGEGVGVETWVYCIKQMLFFFGCYSVVYIEILSLLKYKAWQDEKQIFH